MAKAMTNDFFIDIRGECAPGVLSDIINMLRGIHQLTVIDITDIHAESYLTRLWAKDDDGSGPDPDNHAA